MSNIVQTKVCTKCGQEKPITAFGKEKHGKYGVRSVCRDCRSVVSQSVRDERLLQSELIKKGFKKCSKCGCIKDVGSFYNTFSSRKGKCVLSTKCKECDKKQTLDYRHKNIMRVRELEKINHKKNRDKNREAYNAKNREYYKRDHVKKKKKEYQEEYKHTEARKKTVKESNLKRREKKQQWALDNKDRLNKRAKERKKTDAGYRLKANLRTRMWQSLTDNGAMKQCVFEEYIGCSLDFLKKHLESKFLEGMSWNNYNRRGWWVDHIIPCASFDFNDIEQVKKCFHYTNLQPMWWLDNIIKGTRLVA